MEVSCGEGMNQTRVIQIILVLILVGILVFQLLFPNIIFGTYYIVLIFLFCGFIWDMGDKEPVKVYTLWNVVRPIMFIAVLTSLRIITEPAFPQLEYWILVGILTIAWFIAGSYSNYLRLKAGASEETEQDNLDF